MADYLFFEGVTRSQPPRLSPPKSDRPKAAAAVTCEDAKAFFNVLFELTALPHQSYRPAFLQRRVPACLRFLAVPNVAAAIAKLRGKPSLAPKVLSVVLLGVTAFYRDEHVFRHLRHNVFPAWALCGAPRRVWSAACSGGQELYSVAMLLAEAGVLDRAELLGTDCRAEAVKEASLGKFNQQTSGTLSGGWDSRWCKETQAGLVIDDRLRDAVHWKQADLFAGVEPGPWDLLLWRNMAIYLEGAAANKIWQALVGELAPGGWLITGKADYPPRGLGLVRVAPCIYQKIELRRL